MKNAKFNMIIILSLIIDRLDCVCCQVTDQTTRDSTAACKLSAESEDTL